MMTENVETRNRYARHTESMKRVKRPRGRSGCLNCRRRRKKCDEKKPACAKCEHLGDKCEWDTGTVTFRLNGIDATHPSMQIRRESNSQNFHMVDVTFDSSTHKRIESRKLNPLARFKDGKRRDDEFARDMDVCDPLDSPVGRFSESSSPALATHKSSIPNGGGQIDSTGNVQSLSPELHRLNAEPRQGQDISPQASVSSMSMPVNPTLIDVYEAVPTQLDYLDYLTDTAGVHVGKDLDWSVYEDNNTMASPFGPLFAGSPDEFSWYYPTAEYKELHTTLYNHMVETARGTGSTRQGSPNMEETVDLARETKPAERESSGWSKLSKGISREKEAVLWKSYLDEIVVWLDMFDIDCHFRNTLPVLARTSEALRLSILALAARQLERKDPDKPYIESLGLYQEAIQLIMQDLQTMDTAVIASCVLLCVLEMMSSSPRDWARHLDGCAMLIKAAGINGVSGGVNQAIFWCFARMDLWGGFLTDTNTKIPTSLWFMPSGPMSAAVSRFKADFKHFDQYANYAVFLCASVLNVITNQDESSYVARWKALFDLLEDWRANRPAEMRPIVSVSVEETTHTFPVLVYSNAPAISGNQLYHSAVLLMLQNKPDRIRVQGSMSLLSHARQICGITASNSSHGGYTNAPQPLWIAGRVLQHPVERSFVLALLAHIEMNTGFATAWRADDLRAYWDKTQSDMRKSFSWQNVMPEISHDFATAFGSGSTPN